MTLPDKLAKRRDELARIYFRDAPAEREEMMCFKDGFRTCFEELAPLIEALKFYADVNTYKDSVDEPAPIVNDMTIGPNDFGYKAREALAKIGIEE